MVGFALKGEAEGEGAGRIWARERLLRSLDFSVRVKGGMSLWNGMWHGLRNDIIMRNLIYADHFQRNKLN